jgi:hypothetical protein
LVIVVHVIRYFLLCIFINLKGIGKRKKFKGGLAGSIPRIVGGQECYTQLGWLGMLQYGITSHGFNTKSGWTTNVEFGVKIPQGIDVQSDRTTLREILGGIGKIRRYNSFIECGSHGIGPQILNMGHRIGS